MAPISRPRSVKASKVVKPKTSRKTGTPSSRQHRFQPFSERIAKLKIDAVRRRRADQEELSEDSASYLGRSLEEWLDLNLSRTFTEFQKHLLPLCDSLPEVLHNDDRIMDLLVTYIEKGDALAMEPLLSLMSHFAHDLDSRFEKHFQRAVGTVAAVAAKHSDPAVIEWSFTCLAFLFKYLQRLLTPNLRPLYDLMAPYLGKEIQKPFIIRFTAESLSFLARKAAVKYERDPEPLDLIMRHMLEDAAQPGTSHSDNLHCQGVMTLLTEAITGAQHGLHTGGNAVVRSLMKHVMMFGGSEKEDAATNILTGVLTSTIHHTTPETFSPVLDSVVFISNSEKGDARVKIASHALFTIVSVRKASRVTDWNSLLDVLTSTIRSGIESESWSDTTREAVLGAFAISMQSAPVNAILSRQAFFGDLRNGQWSSHFLRFCDLFARLGRERFDTFVLPCFKKFVVEQFSGNEKQTCSLLPQLLSGRASAQPQCPEKLQKWILHSIKQIHLNAEHADALSSANEALSASSYLKISDETTAELRTSLLDILRRALNSADDIPTSLLGFATGPVLARLLELSEDDAQLSASLPSLFAASHRCMAMPSFWSNLFHLIKRSPAVKTNTPDMETLREALIDSLALPSHSIREIVLDILQLLYQQEGAKESEALASAIRVESMPVSLDTSREINMNIRRLASAYSEVAENDLLCRAIPMYCFGLLHLKLSQAWDEAINTMAEICKHSKGEEIVIGLTQKWLEGGSDFDVETVETNAIVDVNTDGFKVFSDFACPNKAKITAIVEQVFQQENSGYPSPKQQLKAASQQVSLISPRAREQALRILTKLPQLAEKRSRLLVPVLLRWAGSIDSYDDDEAGAQHHQRWSRKDQKSMLNVFAQFVNPRVLYKSEEVYAALLGLCANGDAEIQRSALKALMAWKIPAVNRYEEHLNNLLDDARFREEVSVFLQGESGDAAIRAEDHGELMPVLLRLLYGRAVAGGKHGQNTRRKAIFVALAQYDPAVLKMFVDIALSSASKSDVLSESGAVSDAALQELNMPLRQQLGMLNMVYDMLDTLGSELEPSARQIFDAVLLCSTKASRALNVTEDTQELKDQSLLRSIRQLGLQCQVRLFTKFAGSIQNVQAKAAVVELVTPRLPNFASENAQSVSGMLRLFAAWSSSTETVSYLVDFDEGVIEQIARLLREPSAKDEVRLFVLQEIINNLLAESIDQAVLERYIPTIVQSLREVLRQQPAKDILDAGVTTTAEIAARITDPKEAAAVVDVCSMLLAKPSKAVSARTKAGLLRTLLPLIDRTDIDAESSLYDTISGLFSRLFDQDARTALSEVLVKLCRNNADLLVSADICTGMNARDSTRLDEPDHQKREAVFNAIATGCDGFTLKQWKPIVHNCLFYIRDSEDLVNRTSASSTLERFIDKAVVSPQVDEYRSFMQASLMPSIERGMSESSELVRAEYLRILGCVVVKFPTWSAVEGLEPLTANNDEEASFFLNALHIQHHRRLRAVRRLGEARLSSYHVTKLFLPFLEQFIFDRAEGDSGLTLADLSIQAIASLAGYMSWSSWRATFKRYAGYLTTKLEVQKAVLRLLGALIDALHRAVKETDEDTAMNEAGKPALATSLPQSDIRCEKTTDELLPPLTDFLHLKDESTVDRRVPVALTVVKLLDTLPVSEFAQRLPGVLMNLSQVLRSKSQEARDQTRKTMFAISAVIGPRYFGFMVKELRSALRFGYQLHVMSFTVHSLLVSAGERLQPGDLDEFIPELTSVIMDDIFGVTGQEKEAEEYKSGMKEVKSSKSFDTMEILARLTSVPHLGQLIKPVRALLSEKLDSNSVKKIDELLIRVRKGVDQNPAANSREILTFCYEIVRLVETEQAAKIENDSGRIGESGRKERPRDDYKVKKYLIQMKSNKKLGLTSSTSHQYKLVSFGLSLVRRVVRRHEDLASPANMAGFLPIAGDALIQGHEEVRDAAVKLLSTIIRVPLATLNDNAPVYLREAVAIIKDAPTVNDSAKAALDLVTAILREKRAVKIKETDIAVLLKTLKPDLDEPDRQGIIYKFLRAVLGRKIVITEVYEIMDDVAKMMVMNPDNAIRESARSAYVQFVLEYPQGKDRWAKQTAFYVKNLDYAHKSGRQSVMELLHQLLNKLPEEAVQQLAPTLFAALVLRLANDPEVACKEMAGILVAKLFERADEERLTFFVDRMHSWLGSEGNVLLVQAALRTWTIAFRSERVGKKDAVAVRAKLTAVAEGAVESWSADEGEMLNLALLTVSAMLETTPQLALAKESADLWFAVQRCLAFPHDNVKLNAATLLGQYFQGIASTSSKTEQGLAGLPLRGSGGLQLTADDMRRLCGASLRVLRSGGSAEAATIRNIAFLGRCFAANNIEWPRKSSDEEEPEAEEDMAASAETEATKTTPLTALEVLLTRLSATIRREALPPSARLAALNSQAALLALIPSVDSLASVLQPLLRPLYILTDASIPQQPGEGYRDLSDRARELLDVLQKKLGSEEYVRQMGLVRRGVKATREERRVKRRVEAVAEPEKWAAEKRRKLGAKKARDKVHGQEMRGRRRGW
ncbi:hypothetical protein MBLNU230_g0783t1 [Neophaeotheca triangularis]